MNTIGAYGYEFEVTEALPDARERVIAALKQQGFGVLTEIDVQATLREKIAVEMAGHVILGVCNPQLAYNALLRNPAVGLLLPCTVTLRQEAGQTVVSWLRPTAALGVIDDPAVSSVAEEAERRLDLALAPLSAGGGAATPSPKRAEQT